MYQLKQAMGGIPRKKDAFVLRNRFISIECTISCQRPFVPNLNMFGIVLKRCFKENSCSECLDKTKEVTKEGFTS